MNIPKKPHTWQLAALLVGDLVLFATFNADTGPPLILVIGLLLVALTFYKMMLMVLMALRVYGINIRHQRRIATYATLLSGGLLAWQSLGQLDRRDFLVLLPLLLLGYFYGTYNNRGRQLAD